MLATVVPAEARRFRLPRGAGRAGRGTKSYTADTLSREQLERCLVDGQSLDDAEAAIAKQEASIVALNDELEDLNARLQRDGITLDRYSKVAVDTYNDGVAAYETKRLAFNRQVDIFNAEIDQFNDVAGRYNMSCNGKTYYEDDMEAARLAVGIFD